jgi:hypothetical protein
VTLKPECIRIVKHGVDETGAQRACDPVLSHWALRVSLMDAGVFMLDISGAQHGQNRAVMPFNKYREDYYEPGATFHKFGALAEATANLIAQGGRPAHDFRISLMHDGLARCIARTVTEWEEHQNLATLLNRPDEIYQTEGDKLLAAITRDVRHVADGIRRWFEQGDEVVRCFTTYHPQVSFNYF